MTTVVIIAYIPYILPIYIYIYIVGVRKNKLRYASAHTHIVESLRFAH